MKLENVLVLVRDAGEPIEVGLAEGAIPRESSPAATWECAAPHASQ